MHFGNAYIFQRKMFSNAYILRSKMFSITFSKGKCSAKQNVTNAFDALRCQNAFLHQIHLMRCKNAFDAKMHFGCAKMHFCITFSKGKCSAYIFQRKMFSCAKMHLMQKCIFATHHIFLWKMFSITFDFVKCSASHFPKENVQHQQNVTNAFWRTFSFGKCSAKQRNPG